jgi:hypothetical protein
MDAGTASKSVALGYEPNELSHTLPGNKMVEPCGFAPHPSHSSGATVNYHELHKMAGPEGNAPSQMVLPHLLSVINRLFYLLNYTSVNYQGASTALSLLVSVCKMVRQVGLAPT